MVDEVIDAFKQRIKKHKWIDEKTKKHVNSKVKNGNNSMLLPRFS